MTKKLLVIAILGVLIISSCTVNAITSDNTVNSEKSTSVHYDVKTCISSEYSINVPVNSYIDSDGSQVMQAGGDTKISVKMNKNNVLTPGSKSGVSGNSGFDLVLEEFYVYYQKIEEGHAHINWEFLAINIGDDYTFPTSEVTCYFNLSFNYGDDRDFSAVACGPLTFSNTNGKPISFGHGFHYSMAWFYCMMPDLGKPESITGVFEVVYPNNPDINSDNNKKTISVPNCIYVDYNVVNLVGKPIQNALIDGPWMEWQYSSMKFQSLSDKNGQGRITILPKEPYDKAYEYIVNASKEDKSQSKTTDNVTEGDTTSLSFVLDFNDNAPNKPTCRYDKIHNELVVSATDPDNDNVRFGISWPNDGYVYDLTDWYHSGEEARISCEGHEDEGTVGVIAEDVHGYTSDWISVKSVSNTPFANFLQNVVANKISTLAHIINPVTPQQPTKPINTQQSSTPASTATPTSQSNGALQSVTNLISKIRLIASRLNLID